MKRSDFFKVFFGAIAITAIPNKLQTIEVKEPEQAIEAEEPGFTFDEIFEIHQGNDLLIYPRSESFIYQKIKELVGNDRILETKYATCYLGYHSVLIPIKERYLLSDFMPFVLATKSYYQKMNSFSEKEKGVFFRMFKETPETMHFDLFLGDVRGQYHS